VIDQMLAAVALSDPTNPLAALALADWLEENGHATEAGAVRQWRPLLLAQRYAGGGGYGGGGGGGHGSGNGGAGGDGGGDGHGGNGDEHGRKEMQAGLAIITLPGGYNPFVLVGWCRPVRGYEWEILNCRCVRRYGANVSIAELAGGGPAPTTQLNALSGRELFFRPAVGRWLPCSETAWLAHCPRPADWVGAGAPAPAHTQSAGE
jgi:hypothetical protein